MIFIFCPQCGEKLSSKEIGDEGLVPFCIPCDRAYFNFSYPCVLCLVVDENNQVVLTRNKPDGNYGGVAGYIKEAETAENSAIREVKEETGLTVDKLEFIKTSAINNRLMICFLCKVKRTDLILSKELYTAEWFPLYEAQKLLRQGSVVKQILDEYIQTLNSVSNALYSNST